VRLGSVRLEDFYEIFAEDREIVKAVYELMERKEDVMVGKEMELELWEPLIG